MSGRVMLETVDIEDFKREIAQAVVDMLAPLLKQQEPRSFHDEKELVHRTGLSAATIGRLVAADLIPSVKVGRRRLFQLDKVVSAIEGLSKEDQEVA